MAAAYIQGGTYGPYATFDDGNVFEGVTFIAPVNFGVGNIFIGVTFKCRTFCNNQPCGCCSDVSKVGIGATVVDSRGDHVKFASPSVVSNFTDTGCTRLTLPDCVDCGSTTVGGSVTTTGDEIVVSDRGVITQSDWCNACDGLDPLWLGDGTVELAKPVK